MSLSSQRRIGSCFHPDSYTVRFIAMMAALMIIATAASSWAQPGPQSMEVLPDDLTAQTQATQALQGFWTLERMQNAVPPPMPSSVGLGAQPTTLERPALDVTPGYSPGWKPGTSPSDAMTQNDAILDGDVIPQTSPPFSPPSTPTDFNNYPPFQRWTWLGKYTTYPISTIGKLFFTQPGVCAGGCVCSASVIGTNTLATAGHCVHNGSNSNSGWSSNILFCPSYNSGGVNPARGCWAGVFLSTSFQWFNAGNVDRDYGCIVTAATGSLIANKIGNVTGWTGRAWNWPTKQLEAAFGYPQGAPFGGKIIISTTSVEWYEVDMGAGDGQVSKYIGSDQTGGSSGGPWWLNLRASGSEVADTDGSSITDPGQGSGSPFINGVNSHKRCNASGCPAGSLFTQEMGSPPFRNTAGDNNESEDVFAICYNNGG